MSDWEDVAYGPSTSSDSGGWEDIAIGAPLNSPTVEVPSTNYETDLGVFKGIAKAGSDVLAAPADLMYRGGNAALDWLTGTETDIKGGYPSDYRDKFIDYISGGEGSKTAEEIAHLGGNLATVVAAPSQARNIAAKLPVIGKATGLSKLFSLGAGYGAEGAGYSALFNAKSDTLGEDMTEGAALNMAIPSVFKVAGKAAGKIANNFKGAAEETLERGLGVQYGDRTKGLNRVNLFVNEAGETVPFDKLDDAVGIQSPIQQQVKTLEDAGILANAPNDVQSLKLHITKAKSEIGKTIPALAAKADEVIGKKEILPEFEETYKFLQGYRDTTRTGLVKEFDGIIDDYINTPGTGLQKLNKFTDQLQKETGFESAIPAAQTKLRRIVQYDLRKAAEREFDAALPERAGEFAKANSIYSAAESVGKTLNKPLARQKPTPGDYIKGGSLPMTVLTGALAAPLGFTPAAVVTGGKLLANAAKQYSEAAYPISTSNLYKGLSSKAESAAKLADLGMDSAKALTAFTGGSDQKTSSAQNLSLEKQKQLEQQPNIGSSSFQTEKSHPYSSSPNSEPKSVFSLRKSKDDMTKPKPKEIKAIEAEIDKEPYYSALYQAESGRNPKAKNPTSSASGAFQFIKSTAKSLGLDDPFDIGKSFEAVKKMNAPLIKKYGDDPEILYSLHYLGETVFRKWVEGKPLTDTQKEQVAYFKKKALPDFMKIYATKVKDPGTSV